LSVKQRFFVDIFEGDGAAAVLAAGYRCGSTRAASAMASRLLCNPKIQKAIAQKVANLDGEFLKVRKEHQERLRELQKIKKELAGVNSEVLRGHVATRRERQVFWTKTMMDKREKMNERLRASELLGKSELDFGEQKATNQSLTVGVALIANPDIREMISDITGVALPAPEIRVPQKAPVIDVTPHSDFEPELPPEELNLEEAIEFTKKQHVSSPTLQYLQMSEELLEQEASEQHE